MLKALALNVLAGLLLSGASAVGQVAWHGAPAQLATQTVDGVDSLAFSSQEQAPRPIPALSRTHRSPRAVRHTRTVRAPRRSTTSRYTQAQIAMGLQPSESRLETLHAALPARHLLVHSGTAPRAPAL